MNSRFADNSPMYHSLITANTLNREANNQSRCQHLSEMHSPGDSSARITDDERGKWWWLAMANRELEDEWIERRLCEIFDHIGDDRARIKRVIIEQRQRYPRQCGPAALLARCVEQLFGFRDIRFKPHDHTTIDQSVPRQPLAR